MHGRKFCELKLWTVWCGGGQCSDIRKIFFFKWLRKGSADLDFREGMERGESEACVGTL